MVTYRRIINGREYKIKDQEVTPRIEGQYTRKFNLFPLGPLNKHYSSREAYLDLFVLLGNEMKRESKRFLLKPEILKSLEAKIETEGGFRLRMILEED